MRITEKLIGVFMLCLCLCLVLACGALAADDIAIDETHFPDQTFRGAVSKDCDTNRDRVLSEEEINAVTELYLSEYGISSLEGIENFTSLRVLWCNANALETLDLSACQSLEILNCSENQLTSLNVSGCAALRQIFCDDNALTELDLSGCTALRDALCNNNALTSLNVKGDTSLEALTCSNNRLTSLDVSRCATLRTLYCDGNELTSLNLTGCKALGQLDCSKNVLTTLNIRSCSALRSAVAKSTPKDVDGKTVYVRKTSTLAVDPGVEIDPPVLEAPVITKLTNTASGVKLTWSASEGAVRYEVERKAAGGSWAKLGDTEETAYTDETAQSGVKYAYRVRAAAADKKSFCSSVSKYSASKTKLYLGRSEIESSENTEDGVTLTWSETEGAAQYAVFRKASGGSWAKLGTAEGTTWTDGTAEPGVKYAYRVKALSSSGKTAGAYSANRVIRCAEIPAED